MRKHYVGMVFDSVAVHIEEVQQKRSVFGLAISGSIWLQKCKGGSAPSELPFHASICDSVAPKTTT